jgi:hypothetical protein
MSLFIIYLNRTKRCIANLYDFHLAFSAVSLGKSVRD